MAMQMSSMEMQQAIMKSLEGSNKVMASINENMDISQIRDTLREFQKQMGKADMQGEMMNDAFEMMEDPNTQADAEDVYAGILGEIGLEYTSGQPAINKNSLQQNVAVEESKEEDDLEKRLAALKN